MIKSIFQKSWRVISGQEHADANEETEAVLETHQPQRGTAVDVEFAPNDPLLPYLLSVSGVVEVDRLEMDSPALKQLKNEGVIITVPLVSQGELIGLLNLGSRLSEQEYSSDDRRLLSNLATQAAPALRVAQLARQQQAEARERERLEQELRVARIIQQTLLPKELPKLPDWKVAAYWQPARAVGGDFYDFIKFPNGNLGLLIADVTDKGVPAAMVMATTRAILRATAERLISPGEVLQRANELLVPDIPPKMFVTCLYALLDPEKGTLCYANAGHDLPYWISSRGVEEMRATGMPLGLMQEMEYEEKQITLRPEESVILYSDGLVEAHSPDGEMFGFPRLQRMLERHSGDSGMIAYLLKELDKFTGPDWEQEDDVTFVILECTSQPVVEDKKNQTYLETLLEFEIPSQQGNERAAKDRVAEAVKSFHLSEDRKNKLETAVAEATMNAMEHGNQYQKDKPVLIQLLANDDQLAVRITDHGGGKEIPEAEEPDLDAKLKGLQSPRGWGLFLIKNMVDEMNITTDDTHHTVELIMHIQ